MSGSEKNLHNFRQDYQAGRLNKAHVNPNPFKQFENWFEEVLASKIKEANAMIVATSSKEGIPSVRTVLLKGYGPEGFIFYTNYESRKGKEIIENPNVAILFYWDILERQVRIEGKAEKIASDLSDAYFNKRPKASRIGTIASPQSQVIESRQLLEDKVMALNKEYANQENIKRPDHWGGFIVKPQSFEFWQGRSSRLHDRLVYRFQENNNWIIERLAP